MSGCKYALCQQWFWVTTALHKCSRKSSSINMLNIHHLDELHLASTQYISVRRFSSETWTSQCRIHHIHSSLSNTSNGSTLQFSPVRNCEGGLWTSELEKCAQLLRSLWHVWESHHLKRGNVVSLRSLELHFSTPSNIFLLLLLLHPHIMDSLVWCDSYSVVCHVTCECISPPIAVSLNVSLSNGAQHQKHLLRFH